MGDRMDARHFERAPTIACGGRSDKERPAAAWAAGMRGSGAPRGLAEHAIQTMCM